MRYGNYTWPCESCGHVNGHFLRKATDTCTRCKTKRGETRNVSWVVNETQYALLERNRRNHRTGCPGRRDGRGAPGGAVMTYNDGTPWI